MEGGKIAPHFFHVTLRANELGFYLDIATEEQTD